MFLFTQPVSILVKCWVVVVFFMCCCCDVLSFDVVFLFHDALLHHVLFKSVMMFYVILSYVV